MHSRNVLRAHFALTQVLLSILDPLTSNSSLSLVSLNQHPVFPVIFKSNCCWQNPLKAGCSPLLTVRVQLLLFQWQVIFEPALKIFLCLFNTIQVMYEPVVEPLFRCQVILEPALKSFSNFCSIPFRSCMNLLLNPYSGVRSYMNLF